MLKTNKNKKIKIKKSGGLKITSKITMLYGGVFTLMIVIITVFIFQNAVAINQNTVKKELAESRDAITEYLENGGEFSAEGIQNVITNRYVEFYICDMTTGEKIFSDVAPLPPFVASRDNFMRKDVSKRGFEEYQESKAPNKERLNKYDEKFARRFELPDKEIQKYSIEVFRDNEFISVECFASAGDKRYSVFIYKMFGDDSFFRDRFALTMVIADVICVFIAFLIGRYISKIMLKPVRSIMETAEVISIDDLSQRLEISGPDDEMKELSVTFNSMIERLEDSFKKQTQFVSDASHELRTPISVIQGYAKLVNRWGKSDPVVLQESIDSIISETEHMTSLIKSLLILARSDGNRLHANKQNIRLDEVVADAVRDFNVAQNEREITIEETTDAQIFADPDMIKQLLHIHMENAVKYTPKDGKIFLRVYKDAQNAFVSVTDNGVGIPDDDIKYIFNRFYRADKSRNKEIPGNGLGLSIAMLLAKSNGGDITVESKQGEGSAFINRFKLSEK